MGRFNDDVFEAEFEIATPREEVWQSFKKLEKEDGTWFMPGWEAPGTPIEIDEPRLICVNKDIEPCKDSKIAVHLESTETGTKVMVVQSGFPAWVKHSLESFTIGGNQIVADLVLYLETGVRAGRHWMPWAFCGIMAREVDTGLEVTGSVPGCYAERIGFEPGDRLISLGGAPLFSHLELQTLLRVFTAGQDLEAAWVRGNELHKASAAL